MSKPILDKTSFGILRTNPKLTSNIKLITDGSDRLYLESFDANEELSKSKYKGFKVSSNGDYYYDLYRFYNQNGRRTSNQIAFDLYQRDDVNSVKELYGFQYDMFYSYGAETKPSKLYDEEYSLLAPLWIEPSNIPDYFIICRIEDPVSVNSKNLIPDTTEFQNASDKLIDNNNFVDNILSKSTIISSFDLRETSNLGRYIRKHANNENFPESSIIANWPKNDYFEYNGINLDKPGFCSKKKEMYYNSWPNDKTIIEYENIITDGFSEMGVAHPNIINLEFLFDDADVEDYRFQRYFGLYVNKAQYNEFFVDGNALFDDRFSSDQLPIPTKNNIAYEDNIQDQVQTNENGIVVYAKEPVISSIDPGGTSFFPNEIVYGKARIGYCQDAVGNFHKIKNSSEFSSNTLRLNNKNVNWKDFTGFQNPDNYVTSEFNYDIKGRPACVIEFDGAPLNDDEFRIFFTDSNDPAQLDFIDFFTATASNTIPIRTSSSNLYSTLGSNEDRAIAFASCVRNMDDYYPDLVAISAVAIGTKVVIFSRVSSETWNKIKVTSFTQVILPEDIPIKFISGQSTNYVSSSYQSSPQPFTSVLGFLATGQFVGGNNNTKAKIKVSTEDTDLFSTDKYLVTSDGYSKINTVVPYLDEVVRDKSGQIIGFDNFDSYYTVNITDTNEDILLTSNKQCSIVPLRYNNCGLLSIYPLKDFDFDFYSTQYKKNADASPTALSKFYLTPGPGPFGATSSFDTSIPGLTGPTGWISSIIGPSSEFVEGGEFFSLMGIPNLLEDTDTPIYNEYDRLKENDIKEFAVDSRVVPFVNKWVFDDSGLDVRQNPYRLNVDGAFRYPNFSPSFREFGANPKFYTHEWFYLQKYPPYMNLEERINSFSYFNNAINIGSTYASGPSSSDFGLATVDGPTSMNTDYFTEYFTRETIVGGTYVYPVDQQIKYSKFAYANESRFAETLFRGAKIIVKERFDRTPINYNLNKKRLRRNTKYNDYKFASILSLTQTGTTIKFIENELYKTITLVIEAGLMDNNFTKFGAAANDSIDPNDYFIDRTLLYTLRDQIEIDGGTYQTSDREIGGALYEWDLFDNGTATFGINTQNGTLPDLINELQPDQLGAYNDIIIPLGSSFPPGSLSIKISGLTNITSNTVDYNSVSIIDTVSGTVISNAYGYPWNIPIPSPVRNGSPSGLFYQIPIYQNGGFNAYSGIINVLSFANIADLVNQGDPGIEYITYKTDGSVVLNDKLIEMSIPDELWKANYLRPIEDRNVPNELDSIVSGNVAGFEMGTTPQANINILSRYNGRYQPKFTNIFGFLDFNEGNAYDPETWVTEDEIKGTRYYGFDGYQNLEFNVYSSDNFSLKNYFYNKCNPENPSGVISLSNSSLPSVYPRIGETTIDKRDFYIFLSNWDLNYYKKAIDRTTSEDIIGYQGTIENKSFLGSKILSIPDKIRLETWELIDEDELEGGIGNIDNVSADVVKRIDITSTPKPLSRPANTADRPQPSADTGRTDKKELILNVFSTKALINYLRADGIDTEFNDFINPLISFGEEGLDDDIEKYIRDNIFQRYKVDKIIFYENRFANNVNQLEPIELDLSNFELLRQGYKISENLSIKFFTDSPLDFTLIYNIPKLKNYSISFKVDLIKK